MHYALSEMRGVQDVDIKLHKTCHWSVLIEPDGINQSGH